MATKKFAIQLTNTATDIAAGRGPCENNSCVGKKEIELKLKPRTKGIVVAEYTFFQILPQ